MLNASLHQHHRGGLQRLPCSERGAGAWGTAPAGRGSPGRALSLPKGRDQLWGNTVRMARGWSKTTGVREALSIARVRMDVQTEGKRRVTGLNQAPLAQPSKQAWCLLEEKLSGSQTGNEEREITTSNSVGVMVKGDMQVTALETGP